MAEPIWKQSIPVSIGPIDLEQKARELGIKYFLLTQVTLNGEFTGPMVPAEGIKRAQQYGLNRCGFLGFNTALNTPKFFLVPDPSSLIQLPWKPEFAWLGCFMFYKGKISPICPRYALVKQIERAKALGFVAKTGIEPEFTILDSTENKGFDQMDKGVYQDPVILLKRSNFMTRVLDAMVTLGWKPMQAEHEVCPNQYEINCHYAEAMTSADRLVFLKFMLKSIAIEEGLRVTFMPLYSQPGSVIFGNGAHFNISLWTTSDDQSVMSNPDNDMGLSDSARHFMGGILKHITGLSAITNPTVNSYKRLWMMKNIFYLVLYGVDTKWSIINVVTDGEGRSNRLEVRQPDDSANAYLLHAVILAAGLAGIEQKIEPDPKERIEEDLWEKPQPEGLRTLAKNLLDSLRELNKDEELKEMFGTELVTAFIGVNEQMWDDFMKNVTPWEMESIDKY